MKRIFLLGFILLFSMVIFGQDLNYAKTIIKTLASPEYKGRGYVENGDKMAADFLVSEFENIGLTYFKKGYFQNFKVDVNTFPDELLLKTDKEELIPGKDYLVDPMSPSIHGVFKTYTVKKGDLSDEGILKETIQKSMNKFLIIDERDFSSDNNDEKKKLNELINTLKYSPQIQTAGTVILTNEKLTWNVSSMQVSKPVFIVNKDPEYTMEGKIEVKINAEFIKHYETQNVIGFIEGKDIKDTFLLITAHYDHLGKMGSDVYFPGANDNSSGISVLLNLAKYFKENPPKYSVGFMAFAAEEMGILGAKYYTENPYFDLGKIKFLINFDLAGTGDEGIKVVNASIHEKEFTRLQNLNELNGYLPAVKARGVACNSDHCMFHENGVPCFFIYTLGGIQAYHDIYDKYETLPLTEYEDYVKLMIAFFESF